MAKINNCDIEKLLQDKRVVAEINRHLWIESEKAGYDIGIEKAKEDWLKNFSAAWMQYHIEPSLLKEKKNSASEPAARKDKEKNSAASKRRRAKSYL